MAVCWKKLQIQVGCVLLGLISLSGGGKLEAERKRNSSSLVPVDRSLEVFPPAEFDDRHRALASSLIYMRQKLQAASGRMLGCSRNPMMCLDRRLRPAGPICCGWICVDVTTDVNHCGHCYHHCKYSRSCCHGRCKSLDRDVHNCGVCGRRCPKLTKCVFGLCGYS